MHSLAATNFDQLSHDIEQGAANASAFLAPSCFIRHSLDQLRILLASWQEEIGRLERGLGTRRDHDSPDLVSIDCTTLSKNINCVNTKLAYIAWACESTARILAFLSRVTDRYQKQATVHHEPEDDIYNITNILLETHDLLRCWNTELQDKTKYLSKRVQALVQTVRIQNQG